MKKVKMLITKSIEFGHGRKATYRKDGQFTVEDNLADQLIENEEAILLDEKVKSIKRPSIKKKSIKKKYKR